MRIIMARELHGARLRSRQCACAGAVLARNFFVKKGRILVTDAR